MNLEQFRVQLTSAGLDPYAVGMDVPGGSIDTGYIVHLQADGAASVEWQERGSRTPLMDFASVSEAFAYIRDKLDTEHRYVGSPSMRPEVRERMQRRADQVRQRLAAARAEDLEPGDRSVHQRESGGESSMSPQILVDQVRVALAEVGVPHDQVVVVDVTDRARPLPPSGVWVIAVYPTMLLVGAIGQGQFKAYGEVADGDQAVALVVSLLSPSASRPVAMGADDARARGRAAGDGIRERVAGAGSGAAAALPVGVTLDVVGGETEHQLFAYGTPFPQRSQPPSDVGRVWAGYVVTRVLPAECREGIAAPWFGQPGGGPKVVLDRPIRWYVDAGYLVPLVVGPDQQT